MRVVDKALLRELGVPFLIGTLTVVLMFQANMLIALFKDLQIQQLPVAAIVQIVVYRTPGFLNMTLPVGMALAASLAVGRISRESELTAMRAAGYSIRRVLLSVAVFGAIVSALAFYNSERLTPVAEQRARKLETQAALIGSGPQFRSNVIVNLRNYVVALGTVSTAADGTIELSDVLMVERPRSKEIWLYTAESGTYKDGVWTLRDAYWRQFSGPRLLQAKPGRDVVINERISVQDFFTPPDPNELNARELGEAIRNAKGIGADTVQLEVAYHAKYAVPFACLVFAMVAPVFAVWLARSGFAGVLLSVVLVFLYYNAHIISTQILGRNGWLGPWWAAWLPNLLFLGAGLLYLRRLE